MVSITDKLEGLLPADGPVTKDERVIADAVRELRALSQVAAFFGAEDLGGSTYLVGEVYLPPVWPRLTAIASLAFIAGLIASAIFVGWV